MGIQTKINTEIPVIDRTQEKIALAEELGAVMYAYNTRQALWEKEEQRKVAAMSFKSITMKRINKILRSGSIFFNREKLKNKVWKFCFKVAAVTGVFSWLMSIWAPSRPFVTMVVAVVPLIAFAWKFLSAFDRIEVHSRELVRWEHNLPYGALLALKEAKEQGLVDGAQDCTVYFQASAYSWAKENDPVLVGNRFGVMYEIFSWDDGKLYV